ncbi:hypothetical protein RND81_02G229000 [Saponaria officinalis]|uniref:TORTIFOLIA1/SINE1-2 N-terminal domain-containing protein n=1 Tax=Saponaria officinalis TaxID=3572 RepID=A0AAW1MX71_SAPOF
MSPSLKPTITTTTTDLRQNLLTSLDKLSDRSTFPHSSTHLSHLAQSLPSDHLPTFISCILTVDAAAKSAVKLHSLSLISTLSSTHSTSSLSPHLPKLLPFLLTRLRDPSAAVRAAVSTTAAALSPHNPTLIIHTLLHAVSSEQHVNAQSAACVCLKESILAADWRSSFIDGGDELLKKVLKKSIKLLKMEGFSKAKAGLLGVVESAVGVNGGIVINGKNEGKVLMQNVVSCGVEMLSSEDWCGRKGGAEVLQVVADVGFVEFLSNFKGFVVHSLDSRRFDKVKVTRETMNRAWETWKEIPGDPNEVSPLLRSNSFVSKDNATGGGGSPPLPRKSSFTGSEVYKPKKTMTKSRSSLTNDLTEFNSVSVSSSTQRKQTLSKTRSSLSDDSTITDSSSVSKSSYDFGFETPDSKKQMWKAKSRSSLPDDLSKSKTTSLDYKIEVAAPSASYSKFESEDETESRDKTTEVTTSSSGRTTSGFRYRSNTSRVNPTVKDDKVHSLDVTGRRYEDVGESTVESEELSLIRNQLHQIEKQQSDLLDLVQRFMGNSQNGIDSLETRVSGLEKALDVISHDLAVQTGRISNNGSASSTCCPSTEFLSPKFWRRTDGKSSNSKPSFSGNLPSKDPNPETLQKDGSCADSWGSVEVNTVKIVKGVNNQSTIRGRTWSPKSLDTPSTTTAFTTPVVRRA